ncbi:Na(+)/H(+) exchange regulatory cofactor NHE-RF1 [Stomoxys calcitrans]|uniref:PDZ domain-containing protein n=1 Tax=Stomoxys calcitrans TaxID=35570 RepID=A0A1I8NT85_STOCA|nr:Na(+)/H(+) exchange regulatory cofactor NHE-RF1 [Stomoxys calcitrans]
MSQSEATSTPSTPSSPNSGSMPSSPDVINKAATKLCHIVKRADFDGYGFNLHSEKSKPGQFIGKVDANSPAEAAGLKEGDRILEVNGTAINSETHKQVVQRIKAIACEVRLLLIDVDGKGDAASNPEAMGNGHQSSNNNNSNSSTMMEVSKTEQVLPGASENINSITMVSTKRASQESHRSSSSTVTANANGSDVTDHQVSHAHNNNNNNIVPPPPSATMATVQKMPNSPTTNANGAAGENGNLGGGSAAAAASSTAPAPSAKMGGLHLNMTAAEMRAKLMSKKKYDPKNESVDLKKKYEIVQKL